LISFILILIIIIIILFIKIRIILLENLHLLIIFVNIWLVRFLETSKIYSNSKPSYSSTSSCIPIKFFIETICPIKIILSLIFHHALFIFFNHFILEVIITLQCVMIDFLFIIWYFSCFIQWSLVLWFLLFWYILWIF
jgi:hypothetical protein